MAIRNREIFEKIRLVYLEFELKTLEKWEFENFTKDVDRIWGSGHLGK